MVVPVPALTDLTVGRELFRGVMKTPRFPRIVGGVGGNGWHLCATRGRSDEVVESGFVGNGQDELTPRYIFFTAVGNSSPHPHFAAISTALSSIAAPPLLLLHCCSSARFFSTHHEQGHDEEGKVCRRRRRRHRG